MASSSEYFNDCQRNFHRLASRIWPRLFLSTTGSLSYEPKKAKLLGREDEQQRPGLSGSLRLHVGEVGKPAFFAE